MSPQPAAKITPPDQPDESSDPVAIPMPVDIRSASLTILVVLAAVMFLRWAEAMIIPVVLGVLLSYPLEPLVQALERLRIPRPLASALVLLALLGAGGALAYQLRFQGAAIVEQLPDGARRLRQALERDRPAPASAIEQVQKAANELDRAANGTAKQPPPPSGVQRVRVEPSPLRVSDYLMWGSQSIATAIAQLALVVFLTFFLLASGDLYRRKLVKIAGPSLSQKKVTLQILQEIDQQIERFLVVQVITSALVGVASWLAFRFIGLEQAAVWGLFAGVFNSIPYFGPVVVTAAISIVAFLQFGNVTMSLWAGGLAMLITSLEGFLLTPWLTSRAARMNAVAIFVGLLFWGWIWNVWGVLLAVPMLMVIKAVCDHVEDFKGVGELLGE
jgi:predicted PurR-regulated permease PerM